MIHLIIIIKTWKTPSTKVPRKHGESSSTNDSKWYKSERNPRETEKKEKMMFKDGYTGVSTKGAGEVDLESRETLYPGLSC